MKFIASLIALAAMSCVGPPDVAHAETTAVAVRATQSAIVAQSATPITAASAGKGKTSIVGEPAGAPTSYQVRYEAPPTVADFTDKVTFSDGTAHTVDVDVVGQDGVYNQALKTLLVFFVLATVIESGLSVIFRWRPFLDFFDSRGMKTIVSVLVAYWFVAHFKIDLVSELVSVYGAKTYSDSFQGQFLTALVLAGGSSGVNNLLVALGFRSVRTADQIVAKPPPTEAWISVQLVRQRAVGPVIVMVGPVGAPLTVAVISKSLRLPPWLRYFVRDPGRFPSAGGFRVTPSAQIEISLVGTDRANAVVRATWGPYAIAAGGLVDIELPL